MTDTSSWQTSIARVDDDRVIVRGYELSDLVGKVSYADAVFLVVLGELPAEPQRQMLDGILVSLIEHGISPSSMIARVLASCGTPVQASLAGAALSIADWHGGSGEQLARLLAQIADSLPDNPDDQIVEARVRAVVVDHRSRRERFEGFGHPQHAGGDPRALQLLQLAADLEVSGIHVKLVTLLAREITATLDKPMPVNVTGALAALLLDLGFPWQAIRGLVIAPRTVGLLAHVIEEVDQGGRWRHAPGDTVHYTGPPLRQVPDRYPGCSSPAGPNRES
jgi:citrate synthase